MNAIQTFWAPVGLPTDQIHGGWLDPRFHFMSWALSASLLDAHFDRTVLHTDATGSKILVDLLNLPYREVHLTQEGMEAVYPKNWWVLRKISSYAASDGPFLHVDGDAFLWRGLPEAMQEKPVIAQNDQSGFQCYDIAVQQLTEAGVPLPHFFENPAGQYKAVNMGIVGGTDDVFFKDYVSELKLFYDKYLSGTFLATSNTGYLNTLIEECFFRHYAEHRCQPVATFLPSKPDQAYSALANCMEDTFGMTHLIGTNKKDIYYCKQVEFQLKRRYPETFKRVVRFIEGTWHNRKTFNFPYDHPFPESNLMVRKMDPELKVSLDNCRDLEVRYLEEGKTNLSGIIRFEYAKHNLFQELLGQCAALRRDQQERLARLDQLMGQNNKLAQDTILLVNRDILLMSFLYPGKNKPYYLAAVYDFAFGYRHIAHRSLDDLSIFILLSTEVPVTVGALIKLFVDKVPKPADVDQHTKLLHRIDLKIKELLFLGLVDSIAETDAMPVSHAHLETAGI